MAFSPDNWLDEKLLPLHEWDPFVIQKPIPLSTTPSSTRSPSNASVPADTIHGYKSSLITLLTHILSSNEWHQPLLMIIIDYVSTFPLPLIGRHLMSLEHASARGEEYDGYDPRDVAFHNGYYYVEVGKAKIIVSYDPLSIVHP
jgi:hypothetical protein